MKKMHLYHLAEYFETLEISCGVTSGWPKPTLEWNVPGGMQGRPFTVKQKADELILVRSGWVPTGEHTYICQCTARNKHGKASVNITVDLSKKMAKGVKLLPTQLLMGLVSSSPSFPFSPPPLLSLPRPSPFLPLSLPHLPPSSLSLPLSLSASLRPQPSPPLFPRPPSLPPPPLAPSISSSLIDLYGGSDLTMRLIRPPPFALLSYCSEAFVVFICTQVRLILMSSWDLTVFPHVYSQFVRTYFFVLFISWPPNQQPPTTHHPPTNHQPPTTHQPPPTRRRLQCQHYC